MDHHKYEPDMDSNRTAMICRRRSAGARQTEVSGFALGPRVDGARRRAGTAKFVVAIGILAAKAMAAATARSSQLKPLIGTDVRTLKDKAGKAFGQEPAPSSRKFAQNI